MQSAERGGIGLGRLKLDARRANSCMARPQLPSQDSFESDSERHGASRGLTSADSERNATALGFGSLLRRPGLPAQIERAVDQSDMTIGLRKIAQHAAGQRIELFGKQSHVIAA